MRKNKKHSFSILVFGMLVLLAIGGYAYYLNQKMVVTNSISETSQSPQSTIPIIANPVIVGVDEYITYRIPNGWKKGILQSTSSGSNQEIITLSAPNTIWSKGMEPTMTSGCSVNLSLFTDLDSTSLKNKSDQLLTGHYDVKSSRINNYLTYTGKYSFGHQTRVLLINTNNDLIVINILSPNTEAENSYRNQIDNILNSIKFI